MKHTPEETKRRVALALHAHNQTNKKIHSPKQIARGLATVLTVAGCLMALWNIIH
jgi:hypothetical protein